VTEVNVAKRLGIPDGVEVAFGIQGDPETKVSLRETGDYLRGSERSAPIAGAAEGDIKWAAVAFGPGDVDVAGGIYGDLGTIGRPG